MAETLWKSLVHYAYRHNLPCRGFSGFEILSMLKGSGISEEEKEELREIASEHGYDFEEIPTEAERLLNL